MSEESVDIHIRLSPDGARILEYLMGLGNYTSKSAYIQEMIFGVEDILSSFYMYMTKVEESNTDKEKLLHYVAFSHYLMSILRRLGLAGYIDLVRSEEKDKPNRGK